MITFLFTDIEGSTRLWDTWPEVMGGALARHDGLLHAAIEVQGGRVFKTVGDAFCAAFADPAAALRAALAAQLALAEADWGPVGSLTVRMALHLGAAEARDGDYFGPSLNRVARLLGTAHGGQVVLSGPASGAVAGRLPAGASLRDLGHHRLRGLEQPEHVFQLLAPGLRADFPPLASQDSRPHNLPLELTQFVGREALLEELAARLDRNRLLTLTGIGGCGKTRIALQLAQRALDDFPAGAWFVDLAPIAAPELVLPTAARVLGLREASGRSIEADMLAYLADRPLLLVLDNCEHQVDACARLADTILRRCPRVHILATSREPLAVAGEGVVPVPPLAPPSPRGGPVALEVALASDVVRLFQERARAVQPAFEVTAANVEAVVELCGRLDGIPLAIELAAARVRALPPAEILARLDQRFRLLTGGSRTAERRQQTLAAALDWSHDLLDELERVLLRRLSVFRGGWTLATAEAVCADEALESWAVLDNLTRLVDKSLVVVDETAGGVRYRFLETVRAYAHDRLAAWPGEAETVRARRAAHLLELMAAQAGGPDGGAQRDMFARLDEEHDNLRAALDRAEADGAGELALRLTVGAWAYWEVRALLTEGRRRIERALALAGPEVDPLLRASALYGAGTLALRQGDMVAVLAHGEAALALLRPAGVLGGIGTVYNLLGNRALDLGDHDEARRLYAESVVAYEAAGDRRLSLPRHNLGLAALIQGDLPAARESLAEAMRDFAAAGNLRGLATAEFNLALTDLETGDLRTARQHLAASLATRLDVDDRLGVTLCLYALGWLASADGRPERAARLLGAADAQRVALGAALEGFQQRHENAAQARLAAALPVESRAALLADGGRLELAEALAEAHAEAAEAADQ